MTHRRFYTAVSVTGDNGIALDGRVVKTPLKAPLRLPNRALAEAVAGEWAAQGEKIDPGTMLFTKLANTAIDRIAGHRPRILGEILDYAGSDLVCYRAEAPQPLVARQAAAWDPVVDWTRTRLDAPVAVHAGVMPQPQPPAVLAAVESAIATLSHFEIAAFHTIMTLSGSALISLMLARRAITPEAAWAAAHVDESFQVENWGEDAEAVRRRTRRKAEFDACCLFLDLAADTTRQPAT